jgi:hypothetical protein
VRDGIRTPVPDRGYTPPVGAYGGALDYYIAERVGILSAAYKSPKTMYAAPTAGLSRSDSIYVKVQELCG